MRASSELKTLEGDDSGGPGVEPFPELLEESLFSIIVYRDSATTELFYELNGGDLENCSHIYLFPIFL